MQTLSGPPSRQRQQLASAIEKLEGDAAGEEIRARLGALESAVGIGVDATGAARELALEHGVDLGDVDGTGEAGRVTKGDVAERVEDG